MQLIFETESTIVIGSNMSTIEDIHNNKMEGNLNMENPNNKKCDVNKDTVKDDRIESEERLANTSVNSENNDPEASHPDLSEQKSIQVKNARDMDPHNEETIMTLSPVNENKRHLLDITEQENIEKSEAIFEDDYLEDDIIIIQKEKNLEGSGKQIATEEKLTKRKDDPEEENQSNENTQMDVDEEMNKSLSEVAKAPGINDEENVVVTETKLSTDECKIETDKPMQEVSVLGDITKGVNKIEEAIQRVKNNIDAINETDVPVYCETEAEPIEKTIHLFETTEEKEHSMINIKEPSEIKIQEENVDMVLVKSTTLCENKLDSPIKKSEQEGCNIDTIQEANKISVGNNNETSVLMENDHIAMAEQSIDTVSSVREDDKEIKDDIGMKVLSMLCENKLDSQTNMETITNECQTDENQSVKTKESDLNCSSTDKVHNEILIEDNADTKQSMTEVINSSVVVIGEDNLATKESVTEVINSSAVVIAENNLDTKESVTEVIDSSSVVIAENNLDTNESVTEVTNSSAVVIAEDHLDTKESVTEVIDSSVVAIGEDNLATKENVTEVINNSTVVIKEYNLDTKESAAEVKASSSVVIEDDNSDTKNSVIEIKDSKETDNSPVEIQHSMDVEEIVENTTSYKEKSVNLKSTPSINSSPDKKCFAPVNYKSSKDKPICKLSNTLDIFSDEEEETSEKEQKVESLKTAENKEKQCINIDDDDDIMLIDEELSKKTGNVHKDIDNKDIVTKESDTKITDLGIGEKTSSENKNLAEKSDRKEITTVVDSPMEIDINEKVNETSKKCSPLIPDNFVNTAKTKFADMTRDDLEEFCILKIVESIVDRTSLSDIKNKLKELTQGLEDYRKKAMMLSKQNRDLQVVLKSVQEEQKKATGDTPITPLKITRSVGVQVYMDKAIPRKKTVQQNVNVKNVNTQQNRINNPQGLRPCPPKPVQNIPVPRLVPALNTPVLKTPTTIPQANQTNAVNKNSNTLNGIVRNLSPTLKADKRPYNKITSNETVDLTDDEPPTKIPGGPKASTAPPVRVVPSQSLMPPQRQSFGTSVSSPRKVFIPISGPGSQALRPGQTIMLKAVPAAGMRPRGPAPQRMEAPSMRVNRVTTRHPAPLPLAMKQYQPPNWKSLPPAPDLKLSKVENGIVISWKIEDVPEDSYEEIASYQLFAYQETSLPASTALWKKIGDVKALPLPMACTLTQFMAGFKYYFAVRAVDIRSRLGPFSLPGSILLLNKNILD